MPRSPFADDLRASASLRAWPVVVMSVGLGGAFHASAGGLMPGWFAQSLMALLLWIPARALMARRAPLALIALAVAAGQAFVHLFLTATAGHSHAGLTHTSTPAAGGSPASPAAPGTLADSLGAGSLPADALGVDPIALALHRLAEEMTAQHAAMGLAHAVAGLLVGLWLACGERALRVLMVLLGSALSSSRRSLRHAAGALALPMQHRPVAPRPFAYSPDAPPSLTAQHHEATRVLRGPPTMSTLVSSSFTLAA